MNQMADYSKRTTLVILREENFAEFTITILSPFREIKFSDYKSKNVKFDKCLELSSHLTSV